MQQGEERKNQTGVEAAESSDSATNDNDAGLEAEQESAAAMDADVPQPPQADETTEGQPS